MSNIVQIRPTRRATITAQLVCFDLVPRDVLENVFHAAIAVAWADGDGAYSTEDAEGHERMQSLQKAVSAASQYTVPVQREVDEPIKQGDQQ